MAGGRTASPLVTMRVIIRPALHQGGSAVSDQLVTKYVADTANLHIGRAIVPLTEVVKTGKR